MLVKKRIRKGFRKEEVIMDLVVGVLIVAVLVFVIFYLS